MSGAAYVALLAGTLFAAAGQIALKLGATGRESLAAFVNGWILCGLVAYGVGTALWIFALSKLRLTVVYPFTALTFVLVFGAGVVFLGESTSRAQLVGIGLVLAGLFLVVKG